MPYPPPPLWQNKSVIRKHLGTVQAELSSRNWGCRRKIFTRCGEEAVASQGTCKRVLYLFCIGSNYHLMTFSSLQFHIRRTIISKWCGRGSITLLVFTVMTTSVVSVRKGHNCVRLCPNKSPPYLRSSYPPLAFTRANTVVITHVVYNLSSSGGTLYM